MKPLEIKGARARLGYRQRHMAEQLGIPVSSYIFCMTLCHHRTGASMGKIFGAVFADSMNDAENIVWDQYGGDLCCGLWVEEIPRNGTSHTIYKNMI